MSYLNLVESVLSGWRHNIADRKILEEEFRTLVKDAEGHPLLGAFRKAAGGEASWPALEEFISIVLPSAVLPEPGKPPIA